MSLHGRLWRAALLAGMGAQADALARALARASERGAARSCLEAGAPLQLTGAAPGPAGLRAGVRLGGALRPEALAGLVPAEDAAALAGRLAPLPLPTHDSLGAWLFWTAARQSIFVDLRDHDPAAALARLQLVLTADERARLQRCAPPRAHARPWALRLEAQRGALVRVHVHWLVERTAAIDGVVPSQPWRRAAQLLGRLVRVPERSGRFVIATPLESDAAPALRLSSTAIALVPEDAAKQRALGSLAAELGGAREHVEAMWSLCRSDAPPRWRVGRAVSLHLPEDPAAPPRLRWFFVPWIGAPAPTATSDR
ncbi:MAG: hypothetical protein K1X88_12545 [Nannocystaceae bacterium]|nr:hypothetical protein [Nannocystaceae bacterium]